MNYLFLISGILSFAASYAVGWHIKSYWSFLIALIIGILISVLTFFTYIHLANLPRFGLGVIAVLPVVAIMMSCIDIVLSVIGALLGVFFARKKSPRAL